MSQQIVYDFLKSNQGKKFTVKDICKAVKIGNGAVASNITKVRCYDDIAFIKKPTIVKYSKRLVKHYYYEELRSKE